MVEHIQRPVYDFEVLIGVNVVEHAPGNLADILHIDMGVHDDDHLDVHHLAHTPERMHDLACLHRIGLLDGDNAAIVEHALQRHIDVDDFRQHLLQQRQEDALRRLGEVAVLHGRLAHDRRTVNGILTVRNGRDMEHGIVIGQRIVARMVAKWPFAA